MTPKSLRIIGILLVAAVSFLAGYWPEHRKYLNAAEDLKLVDQRLNDAMGRQRVYRLENVLLQALDHAAEKEYKEAQALASEFFLEVRADMARPDMAKYNPELKEILEQSDAITEALEREDRAGRDKLREVMQRLARMAGGAPTASEPPPVISAPAAPQS